MKVGWDENVPDSDAAKWKKWQDSLVSLNDLKIERWCKGPKGATDLQLHVFADAFTVARGSVCYLRYVDSDHQIHCSLLMAKSLFREPNCWFREPNCSKVETGSGSRCSETCEGCAKRTRA